MTKRLKEILYEALDEFTNDTLGPPENRSQKDIELLEQLPQEDYHDVSVLDLYGPEEEFSYPLHHDFVLKQPVTQPEGKAKHKLMLEAARLDCTPIGEVFYTSRWYCLRVVRRNA